MDGIKDNIEDIEQSEIITFITQNIDYTQLVEDQKIAEDTIINGIKGACHGDVDVFTHQYRLQEDDEKESGIKRIKALIISHFNKEYDKSITNLILNVFNSVMIDAEVNYPYLYPSM